ncbi:MAG: PEP/pyruvate-binding domain-containing protein, partial [Anaerolineales bacterium]
ESHFCANQGTPKENLKQLLAAIRKVYASVKSPNVLLYRRRMGLSDYDERMAILIQEVQGRPAGRFYYPDAAGVAFSRNQFRWNPRIDRQAGFLRLVWGLGTRAVDQIGDDFPRLVALSHPELRPESDPMQIRRHSQAKVDLIDLEDNQFRTLPIEEALSSQTPNLRLLVQRFEQGGFHDFLSLPPKLDLDTAVVTLEGMLRRTSFPSLMRRMLARLESAYKSPVDTEFAATFVQEEGEYKPMIYVLQCRPQSRLLNEEEVHMPDEIPVERRLFVTHGMIPDGRVSHIRYIVYVPPEHYSQSKPTEKLEIARLIGRLNNALSEHRFILIGPGRWGSRNSDLGIPVTYADIYNAKALIEVTDDTVATEPSYGTHFFQDLVEANIYPLALPLNDEKVEFNHAFFGAENHLLDLLPKETDMESVVHVIDVPVASNGALMEIVMDGEAGTAIAYLKPGDEDHLPR